MIKGLFETHLYVRDVKASILFYQDMLGLKLCHFEEERQAAFFWIGKDKQAMLGLWQKPEEEVKRGHFAFECEVDFVLNEAGGFLKSKGVDGKNFFNDGTDKPMVFGWMPALSLYFDDPDGHSLEFIAILDGDGNPDLGILSYEDWLSKK